ncbi:MAG: hypothetical protein KC561_07490 [Myxococcales bacterium]|nr:hypothetical protein [Myxococcales bacterium]
MSYRATIGLLVIGVVFLTAAGCGSDEPTPGRADVSDQGDLAEDGFVDPGDDDTRDEEDSDVATNQDAVDRDTPHDNGVDDLDSAPDSAVCGLVPDVTGDTALADLSLPISGPDYRTSAAEFRDWAELLVPGDNGVKFLLPVDGAEVRQPITEACYFQNMNVFEWHILFLHSFPELATLSFQAYTQLVLSSERIWWGGEVSSWPGTPNPIGGEPGIFGFTIYTQAQGGLSLSVEGLQEVRDQLAECLPFAGDSLVWIAEDLAQQQFLTDNTVALSEAGVAAIRPSQLVLQSPTTAYSTGVGYGFLNVVSEGQALSAYGPTDVVVVESAPNDIALVAGLITANPQSLHSHVNLRLREKGIPNASMSGVYQDAGILALEGRLVRLTVTDESLSVVQASLAEAQAFWACSRPQVGALTGDTSSADFVTFADGGHTNSQSVGVKAANLAELRQTLPAENSVPGFGVPFHWYVEFTERNGIQDLIEERLGDDRLRTDRAYLEESLEEIRSRFELGSIHAGFFLFLKDQIRAEFGPNAELTPIRLRSSTNAEDLEFISGAGLYDSRRGCLADDLDGDDQGPSRCLSSDERAFLQAQLDARLVELDAHPERTWLVPLIADLRRDLENEKPVAEALREVWASLWNLRAFDEREYYGIDHRTAYMGVAVNPSFVMERLNAVVVTNLSVDDGLPLYRVVTQVGSESVVQPADPSAIAEVMTFRRGDEGLEDVQVLVHSNLSESERLWSDDELAELSDLLFLVQDEFEAGAYSHLVPLRLDLEVKLTRDGRIVIKQVRPYVDVAPGD